MDRGGQTAPSFILIECSAVQPWCHQLNDPIEDGRVVRDEIVLLRMCAISSKKRKEGKAGSGWRRAVQTWAGQVPRAPSGLCWWCFFVQETTL